jgi:hypothetical protein
MTEAMIDPVAYFFKKRKTKAMTNTETKPSLPVSEASEIQVVDYAPEHRIRFKEINEQWITRLYVMEEEDIKTVSDPEEYVLKNGGRIYIALHIGFPVGTCAYLNLGEGVFEMIKMAVDEKYRGLKIGKTIGEFSMRKIRELGAKKIILFSNRKGSAVAIDL